MTVKDVNRKIAEQTGLSFDKDSGISAGYFNGYHVAVIIDANVRKIVVSVSMGAGQKPEKEVLKQAPKEYKKTLGKLILQGHRASFLAKSGLTAKSQIERCAEGIRDLTTFLHQNGLQDCSELSGRTDENGCYFVGGSLRFLTKEEYAQERNRTQSEFEKNNGKRGNFIAGIVGALLGSFIGIAVMVFIGQLGYVSLWAGIVMGVCVTKGYELLAGKFDILGMILSVLVMALMVYLGNNLDWAISIMRAYEVNLFDAFPAVGVVVRESGSTAVYYQNLALYYLFTLLGAIPTMVGFLMHKKLLEVSYPIGAESGEAPVNGAKQWQGFQGGTDLSSAK